MSLTILLCLALVSLVLFAVPRRWKGYVALLIVVGGGCVAVVDAVGVLLSGVWHRADYGQNIVFGQEYSVIDPLSALFILLISVVGVSVTIYANGYLRGEASEKSSPHLSMHYIALIVMFVSMVFVVSSRGGYGFLFWWELMTIASFILILFDSQKRDVRRAALSYLVFMHIGFIFLLVGFVSIDVAGLPVTFDSLSLYFAHNNPLPLFVVFLVGFGMKAGVFPLHVWMSETYFAAPSHVPAFMSGVMSKMGIYGVLRVVSMLDSQLLTVGLILFSVGVVTGLWGVMLATVQNDIKRLLAYSSIENMGIIFIAIGAALIGRANNNDTLAICAMGGALLHTVNHSMFKSVLFMSAGNIYTQTRSTSIESMGGLAKRMPVTAAIMLVAIVAICALPPLSGFVSEFLIYYGLLDCVAMGASGVVPALVGIIALSLIGGVVVIAFTKLYGVVFLGSARSEHAAMADEVDSFRLGASALPLAGILLVGLLPMMVTGGVFGIAGDIVSVNDAEGYYRQVSGSIVGISVCVAVLIGVVGALIAVRYLCIRRRVVTKSPTWGCGFSSPNARMQYSGESYTEGLQSITTSITRNTAEGDAIGKDEIFPSEHSFDVERKDKINALFAAWWVELVRRINHRVMSLRTGKVNYYVLYALMFFVLIMLLSLLNLI